MCSHFIVVSETSIINCVIKGCKGFKFNVFQFFDKRDWMVIIIGWPLFRENFDRATISRGSSDTLFTA